MSLSNFTFMGKTITDLHGWFVDILNHLSAKNYRNGDWIPVITGITGSPTVQAWFQRFGIECSFTIIITGTHTMNEGAEITLPVQPSGDGVIMIHSLTTNSTISTASVDSTTLKAKIPNYFVTDETIIIRGFYRVLGI